MIEFGRGPCSDLAFGRYREWLITNGLGGYGFGTVSGVLTRRYHGLLVAALDPPVGRTLLASHVCEHLSYEDHTYTLGAQQWSEDRIAPSGFIHLDRFHLEGSVPVWTYSCADAVLERRIWMVQGANTTFLHYRLRRGRAPVSLRVDLFANDRDHHGLTRAEGVTMDVKPVPKGFRIGSPEGATALWARSEEADVDTRHLWYRNFHLSVEADRGLDHQEDHLLAGSFTYGLSPGETANVTLSTQPDAGLSGEAALARRRSRDRDLLSGAQAEEESDGYRQLILAADQFLVDRRADSDPEDGKSVIAGYPWFGDWGRDTMIALPGLALRTGRPAIAGQILRTYGRYVDRGMIPNRFPESGRSPEYNTVDATLWYVEAVRAYLAVTGDRDLLRSLYPVLSDIVDWHERGTRYGIRVDPSDGLLTAGEPGTQLTWMDAKVDGRVITPRIGKPVEVNALWYNALRIVANCAREVGEPAEPFGRRADEVEEGFDRFWNEDRGYCDDVIDGPEGRDPRLRPNQLLAVSLYHSPLPASHHESVVEACSSHLLTPHGLRSLAPSHGDYVGRYGGGREQRDEAYHQGTVWSWLIGPFAIAHYRVYDDQEEALSFLTPLRRHLSDDGLGTISEIFDGNPPFRARGAPAQAWGVAQLLEAEARIRENEPAEI